MAAVSRMARKGLPSAQSLLGTWTIPVLIALLEGLTHFGIWHGDSIGYVNIVKLFRGTASVEEAQVVHWHGILRPVVPFLALPLSYVMSYRDALATVNLGFLVLGTSFAFLFASKFVNDRVGSISGVCFASAVPTLIFGAAVLTDGPAYATEIVALYFVLFVLEEKRDLRTSLLTGALIGIAVLTKETNFIVLIFLFLRFFLHKDRLKASNLMLILLVGTVIPLVWSQLVGYNYLGFYEQGLAYNTPGYKGVLVQPGLFVLSTVRAFRLCLPFALIGFFVVDDDRFKTLCELLISVGILLVLWPTAPELRFTFLTFPAVVPLAAFGIDEASEVLARRPWFHKLSKTSWLVLFLLAIVIYTNVATLNSYFRTPLG
jgi:4-amino-4-deoxy-L-arabinose transferase-like glycosyltransferase